MSLLSVGLTGLSHAMPIFLVAAAITLVFQATRVADLGQAAIAGLATALFTRLPLGPVPALVAAAAATAALGAALGPLFRHLDRVPEFSRLLVTLGLFLLLHDVAGLLWDGAGPNRPDWSRASLSLAGLDVPAVTLASIAIGPPILGLLLLPARRRFSLPLAAVLSGLAGTLWLLTRQAPSAGFDLDLLAETLLAVVLGGLGSLPGAFVAALLVGLVEAAGVDLFPGAGLALPLAMTAVVLLIRPRGLLGQPEATRPPRQPITVIRPAPLSARLLLLAGIAAACSVPFLASSALPLLAGGAIAILFAASLHLLVGPGGIPSLGHAAFLGIGACTATLFIRTADGPATLPLLVAALAVGTLSAGLAALAIGLVLVRLSDVPLAMLSLVVARLVWTIGDRLGPLPSQELSRTPVLPFWSVLALCLGVTLLLRRLLYAPFGYALRAARDNPVRAAAIGLPIPLLRLAALTLAGVAAGLAGSLAVVALGTVPTSEHSAGGVLMVALGGAQAMAAPFVGAVTYVGIAEAFPAAFPGLLLGPALVAVPLLLPSGIAGTSIRLWRRSR